MIEKILVPVDGSENSKKALEFACGVASAFNAEIFLLHVIEAGNAEQQLVMGTSYVTVVSIADELNKTAESVLKAAEDIVKKQGCVVSESQIKNGPPAKMIVEYANDQSVDTIVMGSRGLGSFTGMLLGSISTKVTHQAECTCITVR